MTVSGGAGAAGAAGGDPAGEAAALPAPLRGVRVIDAHVHAFPPRVSAAVWRWFDRHGWRIREHYRLPAIDGVRFLLHRGVARVAAIGYAHVPGMAAGLNRFVADLARDEPRAIPIATVLPGEPDARAVLDEALGELGCRGVKLHCHVQRIAPDDPRTDEVYAAAGAAGVPVIIHAGDAPVSDAYGCDVRALCTPEALGRALARHPRTAVIVPHLGADRMEETAALLARHGNLHLDTTMALARYFPLCADPPARTDEARAGHWLARALTIVRAWPGRVLYGSDFPNLPYPWDRELSAIAALDLPERDLAAILGGNAARLFGLE